MFCFFFSSRRRHTRCALVTGVQTCALPISTQLLLLRGADTNVPDWESGWTPLHRSFYFGHVKLSLLLLKHGANLGDELEGDWRRDQIGRASCRERVCQYV